MIPKSGNRFSDQIMRQISEMRTAGRTTGIPLLLAVRSHDPEKWEPVFGLDHAHIYN
jgi:hypothetical protein